MSKNTIDLCELTVPLDFIRVIYQFSEHLCRLLRNIYVDSHVIYDSYVIHV